MKEEAEKPWARSWEEVVKELLVSPEKGLSSAEAAERRRQYGPNRLRETKPLSVWAILFNQFKGLIVVFLIAAAVVAFAFGDHVEGAAIIAVILINALIGFVTELKGARSVEALRKMGSVASRVRRDSKIQEIAAQDLVPGDMVVLEGGDVITADLRLVTQSKLQADESVLTGESLPVEKGVEPLQEKAPLAERRNMLFKGTVLTRGSAEAVVVGTGMHTELGNISSLVDETEDESTPLEERLDQLGHWLIWLSLALAVFVAVTGIMAGKETFLMIETAIALAVAAIPEGLPIVATIALARGVWRMAQRNALVKRLSAVETLGSTSVILTDKTGTLTENRMTVTRLVLPSGNIEVDWASSGSDGAFKRDGHVLDPAGDRALVEALEVGALCNNAAYSAEGGSNPQGVGDPLEVALLAVAANAGIRRKELIEKTPEVREEAFDSSTKMMATFHQNGGPCRVAVKGAPEPVLEASSALLIEEGEREISEDDRKAWLASNQEMAEEGLRVLALATKSAESCEAAPYQGLTFLGLVGLLDPPRKEVKQALSSCKEAGIRVIMATGDQAVTARIIGHAVGLVDDRQAQVVSGQDLKHEEALTEEEQRQLLQVPLFARVSPEQKLDLIAIHQKNNSIVAMTGDGVNDAPALKKADIGIAMGQRGTQVAREASDMILKDDAFSSIVVAVEQGRIIFGNIRKFVLYLLSCNVSELMVVTLAAMVNAPLPILPLQILFLNLVTDVFPALALAAGEGSPGIMRRPPRDPEEPIVSRKHWLKVGGYGAVMTVAVLAAFALALVWLNMEARQAVTVSFLTLAFSQLWHVFNVRDRGSRLLQNEITGNRFVWGALGLCTLLLLGAVYLPGLSHVLKTANPGTAGWLLIVVASLIPFVVGQVMKAIPFSGQASFSPESTSS
ncbi:MAG: HAD-IC family P-type ATPase [Thermodesulfobacteriota bacterium]|nr:HAD-IC family P-type ATPase [Thermodesulfobacteriota bacterium]